MKRQAFEELNARRRVAGSVHFHQGRLRRRIGLSVRFGLCAALVEIWWDAARNGGDAVARLESPGPELLREIVLRQCRSAYLRNAPAEGIELTATDRALLELKYGSPAPAGAETPLEMDLQGRFGAAVVESRTWSDCQAAPDLATIAPAEPGLRLLLLRYGTSGHRMALMVEAGGGWRFFDPNSGEVRFWCAAAFAEWFADFWEAAGRHLRAPNVTVYRFSQCARAATSNRGS